MICDLSPGDSVGAVRMIGSLASFLKTSKSVARALDVLSSDDVFTAAVYYKAVASVYR